jgi:cytosine/adenosine deaminase-related metal-dependent hydrolase
MIQKTRTPVEVSFRARWIWTGDGQPIGDSVVSVHENRIASVVTWKDFTGNRSEVRDLGDCCLLPGFINSHTHLEFSDLAAPIPAGKNFAEWILKVVQHRMLSSLNPLGSAGSTAIERHRQGAQEARNSGTALALNVVHGAESNTNSSIDNGLYEMPFAELMSTTDLRRSQTWRSARSVMRACLDREQAVDGVSMGLSPHAPYTTTANLIRQTRERCCRFKMPLMMHLAETQDEIEWIQKGTGPLQDMLDMMVGPLGKSTSDRLSLSGYVSEIVRAPKSFVVHGNYLDTDSKALLAKHRETAAVVYCPRTHQHFTHSPYPLEQMLKLGVRVLLGTDSRASNPDLSIWEEARAVSNTFPSVAPEKIIRMITSDAAEFLGIEKSFGFIRRQALVNWNMIPCTSLSSGTVLEEILNAPTKPSPVNRT